ncbi:MAG: response regulator [Caldilineaceae bacterium]|nr:response regulator [Caldilineaceae bacterium]
MLENSIQTLLVEDNPGDTLLLRQMLTDTPFWRVDLTCTERLQSAMELAQQTQFDVILLDLSLPDSRGYATFERLRHQTSQTPIILLTSSDDQELAVRAVRGGAQDYLIKGEINAHLLVRSMRYAMERKRTEEALRDHHLRYQALFENNHIGVYIIGMDGALMNLNQQGAVLLDYPVESLIGTPLRRYLVPHEHAGFDQQWAALLAGKMLPLSEQTLLRSDGSELPVELHHIVVRNGNGKVLYIQSIVRDVSKRKQAEAALEAERTQLAHRVEERTKELSVANAELQRSARLKDEFLATVSHELRTPLSVILTLAEAINDEVYGETTQRQRKAIERIVKSGRHLLELINDIIDVSKVESGKLTLEIGPVSVTNLCEDCLQMVQEIAQSKQIQLTKSFSLTNDLLYADGRRLMQILLNLLNNAVKFTPEQGRVMLEVYEDAEQESLTLVVSDTGIGIANEDIAKLFRPFIQLDSKLARQYQGAGLGLALVYRLTRLHGGSVAVESVLNQGSRFTIVLPHHRRRDPHVRIFDQLALLQSSALPTSSSARATPMLLILADENEFSTHELKLQLAQEGHPVVFAQNGLDAVAQSKKHHPALLLVDMQLPQLDSLEAIRQIRQHAELNHLPIIALTALAVPGDRERYITMGVDEFVRKPLSQKLLRNLLRLYDNTHAR